jgi:hypothetical protein
LHAAKGVACGACHEEADAGGSMSMPLVGTCLACHGPSEDRQPYPYEKALQERPPAQTFLASPRSSDIKVPHSGHAAAGVACSECHPDPDVPRGAVLEPAAHAARCEGCHEERGIGADCAVCHLETRRDRPPDSHREAQWMQVHGRDPLHAWDLAHERSCALCHSQSFCGDCHRVEKPADHTEFFRQRGHGIAVGIERERCIVCHQESFCVRCHQETQPRSHFAASWGGMTSNHCISCHEPLGASRCAVCHRGTPSHSTAPRIPPPPHMGPASNCYQCHLRPPHADNGMPCTICHR